MSATNDVRPRVVIVGAGFGGLAAAKGLAGHDVDVTVLDRKNHHVFQPLLYQVATAGLNPADIAQPIRRILRSQANCRVMLAEVTDVNLRESVLETSAGPVEYDYLVIATGATHAYFGHDDWKPHAPGLKSIEDALEIRRRILLGFERAESSEDLAERARNMTFVVVGAGPTGVELAGAVKEIAMKTLRRDFRNIDTRDATVVLIEAGDCVLPTFPEKLSISAKRQLTSLGVDVQTGTRVTEVSARGVNTSEGFIDAATVLWAAGVAASPLGASLAADIDSAGRVSVDSYLSVAGYPNVFVIGDLAAVVDSSGVMVPGVAPAAQQGGEHVAAMILADLAGTARRTFVYKNKGSLATIGKSRAVADLGKRLQFGGYFAWLVWWTVHIWSLIGFGNRVRTMAGWAWQYWTGYRQARLITGDHRH